MQNLIPVASLVEVTLHYAYQSDDETSKYTYDNFENALAACRKRAAESDSSDPYRHMLWYCIEEHTYYPCDNSTGQLYIGLGRHTFNEVSELQTVTT